MNLYEKEIIERLLQVDRDMALIDTSDDVYTCVIAGGSALVLMKKIYRSTHDIDSIDASDEIKQLLELYNINMNVNAYRINFPENYLERIVKVNIPTKKVNFYTLSLEDLVVSKLCAMRGKDIEDIEKLSLESHIRERTAYDVLKASAAQWPARCGWSPRRGAMSG